MQTRPILKPGLCCERTMMNGKGMIIACLWAKFLKILFIVPTDAQ